ncbi:MAG: ABC transporter substrate-binding protein [Streptococcus sp.]
MKSFTSKSSIEMSKNENYWDKDNVHITDVKLEYYDGQDQSKLANSFEDNALSLAKLFPTGPGFTDQAKKFKDEIIYTPQDASTFVIGVNIDRQSYKYTSKQLMKKNHLLRKLLNKDFRQAISFAFDREVEAKQMVKMEQAN